MPQVPYSPVPDQALQNIATPEVRVPAPAAAFGENVAQSIQGLGHQFEHSGNEIFSTALKMQDLNNRAEVDKADAAFMEAAGKIHADFGALSGEQAKAQFPKFQQDLRSAREATRNSLSNPMSQKMFDTSSLSTLGRTIFNAAGHVATETKRAAIGAVDARSAALDDSIARNPDDDVGVNDALDQKREAARRKAELLGLGPEATTQAVKESVGAGIYTKIVSKAKTGPEEAGRILEDNRGWLTAKQIGDAEDVIKQSQNQIGSRIIAEAVTADLRTQTDPTKEGATEQQRVQEARRLAEERYPNNPVAQDLAEQKTRIQYNSHMRAVKDFNQTNKFMVLDGIQGNYSPNGMKPTTLEELYAGNENLEKAYSFLTPPQKKQVMAALAVNAKRDFTETPEKRDRYHTLLGMADDPATAAEFMEINTQAEELPARWRDKLYDTQRRLRTAQAGDPRVSQAMDIMKSAGLTEGFKTNKNKLLQFRGQVQLEMEQYLQEHGGKGPKPEEIRQMGARLIQDQGEGHWWSSTQQLFTLPIPEEALKGAQAEDAARGVVKTDEQYRQEYVRERYKELMNSATVKGAKAKIKAQGPDLLSVNTGGYASE